MNFEESFKRGKPLVMSSPERQKSTILVVEPEVNVRQAMRQSLLGLGFGAIADAGDHAHALQKIEERSFTHIIFDARQSRIPAREFLKRAYELDPQMIAIASSYEPTVDDVFDLLIGGARGYIVKPFTTQSLDDTLVMSTKGEAISDAVLNARNRNEALAALTMSSLDALATLKRQSRNFDTAKRELPGKMMAFRRAVDLAHTFAKGGPLMLRETFIDLCVERSQGPATRLGRRRRRHEKKLEEAKENEINTNEANLNSEESEPLLSTQTIE